MPTQIIEFLKREHVLTLATIGHGMPQCANAFYAFMHERQCIVFASSADTQHIKNIEQNQNAAVCIYYAGKTIAKIQGIQMQGIVYAPNGMLLFAARTAYLKRFPFAALSVADTWIFEPLHAKFTDNKLGIGRKIKWDKQ
jgi:uncharacterized protein YhbP (UPF0306 family)